MSGVKGMHKAWRGSGAYADAVRARIKAGGIAKRLEDYVVGKISLEPAQVTAALGLLRKIVPDCASVEHSGEVIQRFVADLPEVSPSVDAWSKQLTHLNA